LTPPDVIAIFPVMKFSKLNLVLVTTAAVLAAQLPLAAQTNVTADAATNAAPAVHQNAAIIPVPRTGGITNRQSLVLQRAKEAPGDYDIEFIGDSITQGWEGGGKNVWAEYYGHRKVINMGVSGDRTEHVLWRFEQGQLAGIKAKAAVVMIGTNNSGKNKDGTDAYTDSDILEGVTAIVQQIRTRQPDTKIILCAIFPRGKTFSPQRGRLLEINQAIARLDDGKNIFYLDFGSQFIENDGSISKSIMPDALHPNEAGYKIWAAAIEPKLKELLAN
jgi:beta-glucosidase